jgi:signal transduction histidine kinase/DNA-binding LacI/PurR family transcriptional regulator/AraC-like DNA-binding protein
VREDYSKSYSKQRLTIGVLPGWQVYWETLHPFFEPLLRGIHRATQELDCNLLLSCGIYRLGDEGRYPALPIRSPELDFLPIGVQNTDGLIIIDTPSDPRRTIYTDQLISTGHPLVSIGFNNIPLKVLPDNQRGIQQGFEHLWMHGHKRIAFIAGTRDPNRQSDSQERLLAYTAMLEKHGLNYDPRLVAYSDHWDHYGYLGMQDILRSGAEFTAVLTSNDAAGFGAMKALREAGLRIPQDVAVVGFDNHFEAAAQPTPLTTTSLPLFEMGVQAVQLLHKHIHQPSTESEELRVIGPLVVRSSCGCDPEHKLQIPDQVTTDDYTTTDKITQLALSEMRHIRHSTLRQLCQLIVDGLEQSIAVEDPAFFQQTLASAVAACDAEGDSINVWYEVLSLLHKSKCHTPFAETLLEKARSFVALRSQQQVAQQLANHHYSSTYQTRLAAHLHSALTVHDIFQVFATQIESFGVQTMQVVFFETDGEGEFANLHTLANGTHQARDERFPIWDFPLWDSAEHAAYQLALLPLIVESKQIGFVSFDARHLPIAGAIVWHLSTALRSKRLYDEAVVGRQLAEEANRLKSTFLATVSHELRTPLSLITGLSDMLLRGDSKQVQEDLRRIYGGARHLGGLINDVLDLASSEAGELRLSCQRLDLLQVLHVVAQTGEHLAHEKGLVWQYRAPEALPNVWGDATRLRQIAFNLVSNAVKFTERGHVCLEMELYEDGIRVLVSDTGIGIPPEEHEAIFDEFRQSERTSVRAFGGLGLGLAICKRLIHLHGGTIGVLNSSDSGSTLYFSLPVMEGGEKVGAAPETEPYFTSVHGEPPTNQATNGGADNQTVLIVDDDPTMLDMYARMVKAQGCRILTAHGGREALHLLQRTIPDLILLDLMMPEVDGFQVLKALRNMSAARAIPVVVLTARTLNEQDMAQLNANVTSIVSKGVFTVEETLQQIESALKHSRKVGTDTQRLVRRAMAYIHTHYSQPLSRGVIAAYLSVNEDYLTRSFTEETGVSPIAYLNRYRVHQAKRLLEEGGHSMTEIALSVGFTDNVLFSRVFRRETGMTPSAYRDNWRTLPR